MSRSLVEIENEIARLKLEADRLKREEREDVIARIRAAVAHYGITRQEVFAGRAEAGRAALSGDGGVPVRRHKPRTSRPAKYADDQGNTWSGRGKRPHWLARALAEGKTLEDLAIKD